MKQFFSVFRFEFSNYIRSKPYIIITAVIVAIIAGILTYPRVSSLFKQEGRETGAEPKKIALVDDIFKTEDIQQKITQAFPTNRIVRSDESADVLKSKVADGEYESAIIIESPLKFTYMTVSVSLYENPVVVIREILKEKFQLMQLEALGLGAEQASAFINPPIDGAVVEAGKSQAETIIYTYILIYALYMAILLYGQFIATSVASEKSTRAMELLITNARPLNLLFGKIIGTGLAGLVQFGIIFGSAFLFYNLNADIWAGNQVMQMIFNIPLDMLFYVFLFFIIGFFLYAFLYGALGSLVSRTEDVGTAVMPVTFLFIITFFIVMFGMGSGKINSPLMVMISYIPFTSPMAMFTRIAMSNVAPAEIVVSVTIAVLTTVGVGFLSAAIYRVGILMYGKPPKIGELIKTLRGRRSSYIQK